MKSHIALLLILCLLTTALAQAAGDQPELTAGHKKMLEWCGEWSITGKTFTSPFGPGREIKGKWIGKPILDGFAIEGMYFYEGKGPSGETQAKEISTYDPATNTYQYVFLSNNGYREQAPFTVEGPVAAWEGTQVIDGKTYKFRGRDKDLPDGTGFVRTGEVSADGQTWQPNIECRHIKVQTTSDEQELIRLAAAWENCLLTRDVATLDRLWAEEYTSGTPDGKVRSKKQSLAEIQSDDLKITSAACEDLQARVYGDMGVTTGIAIEKGQYKGTDISGKYRFTDTWIKRNGRWQCVATHASRVSEGTDEAAKAIEGLWSMQAQTIDGAPEDMKNRKALKSYQNGIILFLDFDTSTGKINLALGGDYSFDGKTLTETVRFVSDADWVQYLPASFTDNVRFEGESFRQSGNRMGSVFEEAWRRVGTQ